MPFDYDAPIYYPPYENRSILIPASYGCPHNQCAFCSMYKDTPYREVSLLDIKQSIREVSEYRPCSERVFLLGGQSFCLKADKRKEILRYIRERLPLCEAVSMYASIRSVADKTDADLAELKALGLGKLYIGVESGCDEILEEMHKGHTGEEAARQLKRLNQAGIPFHSIIMYGIGGRGRGIQNALATANVLNQVESVAIVPMCLTIMPSTELERRVHSGEFEEANFAELLLELRTLLENLDLNTPTPFATDHATNRFLVAGTLPQDKEKMVSQLDQMLKRFGMELH